MGEDHVPFLDPTRLDGNPSGIVAFDDLSRSECRTAEGVHFYRDDKKFAKVLRTPASYAQRFSEFSFVLTPDCTLFTGLPRWDRVRRTVWSLQVGVVWQSRGLRVIPVTSLAPLVSYGTRLTRRN